MFYRGTLINNFSKEITKFFDQHNLLIKFLFNPMSFSTQEPYDDETGSEYSYDSDAFDSDESEGLRPPSKPATGELKI